MTSLVIHTALDWLRKNRRLVPTEHEVLDIIPAHEPDLTPEEQMDWYRLLDIRLCARRKLSTSAMCTQVSRCGSLAV